MQLPLQPRLDPPGAIRQHPALHQGFAALGARDREILTLRHFDELSYREIAVALEIPEGTVMSRLCRARERVRCELQRRGDPAAELDPERR